jgi:hypothetical protein
MKLKMFNKLKERKYAPYPGWFFTNERLEPLITSNNLFRDIQRVYAIGGGGDFAYSFISLYGDKLTEVHTCDVRPIAKITQDFKSATIRHLDHSTINKLWAEKLPNESEIIDNIISGLTEKKQRALLAGIKPPLSVQNLKRSKLWYRDSFWQVKKPEQYLGYLTTTNRYDMLKRNISKIQGHHGDLFKTLTSFPDNHFDLIYLSNIYDSADIQRSAQNDLSLMYSKLSPQGKLVGCVSGKPKKINRTMLESQFEPVYEELHSFSIFSAIRGHYDYSYFLYQKTAH